MFSDQDVTDVIAGGLRADILEQLVDLLILS
ncbi:hypothetical protein PG2093B_0401 [Bifidobacterium pseudolongum subsp. globosum]|uniref:Uncharacterized protein n=1 Tax=Bifidobacterium pseudolongum subsp. globosum TaxID=1690 RepID=A0A4Q5A1J4_9BIFI|nr:hypothetical protein PG2093B_0401 [Bifidobacterium pseudolongum subsp. globosum]